MRIPSPKELIDKKKIEATKEILSDQVLRQDDDYTRLANEALESNKDILAITTALIMVAPVLSIALTLFNLNIDSTVLRIMYTMLAGQFITNALVVYVIHKQFNLGIRRNTKSVYMHFTNKESVRKIKEMEEKLSNSISKENKEI